MSTLIAGRESAVKAAVQSGWRRRLTVLSLEELGLALCVVLAGAMLMLLLGTQILEWYWLLLLASAGLIAGAARVRRRVVGRYEVAQMLDERLELNDSLSTAWFLLTSGNKFDPNVAGHQIRSAEALAGSVQPARAFPVVRQRSWTVAGVMACAVLGLFGARYFVTRSLSLRPPFVSLVMGGEKNPAAQERTAARKIPAHLESRLDEPLPPEFRTGETNRPKENATKESRRGQSLTGQNEPQNADSRTENAGDPPPGSEGANPGERKPEAASSKHGQQAGQHGSEQQQSPGLLEKMKDALAGVMAKMKQNASSQAQSHDGRNASSEDKRKQQSAESKDGASGQTRGAEQQKMDASSETQAQSQTAEKSSRVGADSDQGPQGKSSDSQSGAGRQDGEKALTEAEQLKAMGRLEEIIGKRSANVTGDMTVEKSSRQQQLRTKDSQKVGHHEDAGGEINRDEIPFEYRDYIRQYMTEVHKQAQAKH